MGESSLFYDLTKICWRLLNLAEFHGKRLEIPCQNFENFFVGRSIVCLTLPKLSMLETVNKKICGLNLQVCLTLTLLQAFCYVDCHRGDIWTPEIRKTCMSVGYTMAVQITRPLAPYLTVVSRVLHGLFLGPFPAKPIHRPSQSVVRSNQQKIRNILVHDDVEKKLIWKSWFLCLRFSQQQLIVSHIWNCRYLGFFFLNFQQEFFQTSFFVLKLQHLRRLTFLCFGIQRKLIFWKMFLSGEVGLTTFWNELTDPKPLVGSLLILGRQNRAYQAQKVWIQANA